MAGIRLIVAKGSMPTGRILEGLLLAREISVNAANPDAIVSYGVRVENPGLPTLNARAGMSNKFNELTLLRGGGVQVPECWKGDDQTLQGNVKFPLLARRFAHRCGYDIRVVRDYTALRRWQAQRDYFVRLVESDREFRVWVYRNGHLGTYEKILVRPEEKKSVVSRNHRNGYAFQLVESESVPRGAVEQAKRAVGVLGLDFGAVDILHGLDGKYWTLEVNTAPGTESAARQCIVGLANSIKRWVDRGYLARKVGTDAE